MMAFLKRNPILTIEAFEYEYYEKTNCYFENDKGEFTWDLRWFELANEEKDIKKEEDVIMKKENKTIKIGDKVKVTGLYPIDIQHGFKPDEELIVYQISSGLKRVWFYGKRYALNLNQVELIRKKTKKSTIDDVQIVEKGNMTKVIIEDKVEIAKCDTSIDKFDKKIGILIATARALKFDKTIVDGIIDVLFNNLEINWKYVSSKALFEEILRRINKSSENELISLPF